MKRIIILLLSFLVSINILTAKELPRTVKLNTGYEMPILGLGTWTLTGKTCENAVYSAIKCGYRLIDTAKYYGNEEAVGRAVRRAIHDGIVTREEIFITTKLVPLSRNPHLDIDDSLRKLGVEYIDLCLLHQHGTDRSDETVYRAMIKAVKNGKIRSIGISNFYSERAIGDDFEIRPAVVQNENHLLCHDESLRLFCGRYDIYIESYYPLGGRGHVKEHLQNVTVQRIAKQHSKLPVQIIIRWHIQSGYIAIPGSSNPDHIRQNIGVWDWELSDSDMFALDALNTGKRYENW